MNKLTILAAVGAIGFNFTTLGANIDNDTLPQEKCYCIAKAGHNDCSNSLHSCAGASTKDFDCNDWKYVAKGSCQGIEGSIIPGEVPKK